MTYGLLALFGMFFIFLSFFGIFGHQVSFLHLGI